MNKQINAGIIGFGLSGRYFFAPFLDVHQGFNLKAIVTSQKTEVKSIYPSTIVYSLADELLADSTIDIVVVATPNYTHFELAQKALLAGKHVIVEKPFTVSTSEAKQLIELSQKQNKKLIPFQNRRWDGDFLTIKELIKEDALGEIVEFESHFDRFRPIAERVAWKNDPHPGTGNLWDLGPHLIDQALDLFGRPDSVYAHIRKLRPHGLVDDSFEIQLYYPGLKVILKAGIMLCEPGARFSVHGRKGSYVKHGLDVQEENLKKGILPRNTLLGKDLTENFGVLHVANNDTITKSSYPTVDGCYMEYFENVYRSIALGDDLVVTPSDGLLIIEVIEAAIKSNIEKRVVLF